MKKGNNCKNHICQLARDVGMSHTHLRSIIDGRRNTTHEMEERIFRKSGIRVSGITEPKGIARSAKMLGITQDELRAYLTGAEVASEIMAARIALVTSMRVPRVYHPVNFWARLRASER